ncbi:LacI family DNA-binding transcriptional regulator [Leifsonia sp. RAF41]|uniref:LacI family DNA-binding transcriptional regulator n=1 Tax=Leifsonia sp. RAF41 TaxID=3233056 RepID=UPI003F9B0BE1
MAARARVSKSAVSFVFNGRRGLSAATTARIIRAADELGWRPSARARALAGNSVRSVGLVIRRGDAGPTRDAEIAGFLEGLGTALAAVGVALVVRVVSSRSHEREAYAAFARESHVDVVLIEGSPEDDDRPVLLTQLGLRFVRADQGPEAALLFHCRHKGE